MYLGLPAPSSLLALSPYSYVHFVTCSRVFPSWLVSAFPAFPRCPSHFPFGRIHLFVFLFQLEFVFYNLCAFFIKYLCLFPVLSHTTNRRNSPPPSGDHCRSFPFMAYLRSKACKCFPFHCFSPCWHVEGVESGSERIGIGVGVTSLLPTRIVINSFVKATTETKI